MRSRPPLRSRADVHRPCARRGAVQRAGRAHRPRQFWQGADGNVPRRRRSTSFAAICARRVTARRRSIPSRSSLKGGRRGPASRTRDSCSAFRGWTSTASTSRRRSMPAGSSPASSKTSCRCDRSTSSPVARRPRSHRRCAILYGGAVAAPGLSQREGNRAVFNRTRVLLSRPARDPRGGAVRRGAAPRWLRRGNVERTGQPAPRDAGRRQTTASSPSSSGRTRTRTSCSRRIRPPRRRQSVAGPGAGNEESPSGWLGAGTQTTFNISGNNAHAYLDTDANNAPDRRRRDGQSAGTSTTAANLSGSSRPRLRTRPSRSRTCSI